MATRPNRSPRRPGIASVSSACCAAARATPTTGARWAQAPISPLRWTFIRKNFRADATSDLRALRHTPVLLITAGHDRNVDAAETTRTYRRILDVPGKLQIRHYREATHSLERTSLEQDQLREALTAAFAPRSLTAPGYHDDLLRFLRPPSAPRCRRGVAAAR